MKPKKLFETQRVNQNYSVEPRPLSKHGNLRSSHDTVSQNFMRVAAKYSQNNSRLQKKPSKIELHRSLDLRSHCANSRALKKARSNSVHTSDDVHAFGSSRNLELNTIFEKQSLRKNYIKNNIDYVNTLSERVQTQKTQIDEPPRSRLSNSKL